MDYQALLEFINREDSFGLHNGVECTEIRDGFASVQARLSKKTANPQGVAHGSLIFTLCDIATGLAAVSGGRWMLTLNSSISFLRPGTGQLLRCEGRRVREGRTTGLFEAEVYDDSDRLVAKGSFTAYFSGEMIELPALEGGR